MLNAAYVMCINLPDASERFKLFVVVFHGRLKYNNMFQLSHKNCIITVRFTLLRKAPSTSKLMLSVTISPSALT